MRTAVKNSDIEADFQRKVFLQGNIDDVLLYEFTTAEFEVKSLKGEGKKAFDGTSERWEVF